jgi:hypothetical protein
MKKVFDIEFTLRDIQVIKSWIEDRVDAGHWGDGAVLTQEQDSLMKILNEAKPGLYHLDESLINQIIHDAEKCFSSSYGMFNAVGSIFEIAALYKLNKTIGKGDEFLQNWEVSDEEIISWLEEYE